MSKGHGNRAAQQRNRRKNNANSIRCNDEYLLIDGNFTHFPAAYCALYQGFLTGNLKQRHSCERKQCPNLRSVEIVDGVASVSSKVPTNQYCVHDKYGSRIHYDKQSLEKLADIAEQNGWRSFYAYTVEGEDNYVFAAPDFEG